MQLTTVNSGVTLGDFQIQRNIQKIGFQLDMTKAAAASPFTTWTTQGALIFITIKKISKQFGEKQITPRMSLLAMHDISLGIQGKSRLDGDFAGTTAAMKFAFEVSLDGNVDLKAGDYISVTVENGGGAGSNLTLFGLSSTSKSPNHFKYNRVSFNINEFKRVDLKEVDLIAIPSSVLETRFVGNDAVNVAGVDIPFFVIELSGQVIATAKDGENGFPTFAVIPTKGVDFVDITNGGAAAEVFTLTQKDY